MLNRLSDLLRLRMATDSMVQPTRPAAPIDGNQLELGSVVRGQVVAVLPRGLFEVRVEDRSLVLRLPYRAKEGDQLQLVITSREPQLKFALVEREDLNATPTRLSETAHFVTSLLGTDRELPLAAGARVRRPIIAGPRVGSPEIAASLKQALVHSGIFYEAHQAEWVAGRRQLEELRREPQAQLDPLPRNNERRATEVLPPRTEAPVHREALAIVRQQLDTIDTRHLAWTGTVWPGQIMDWEVSEHSQHARQPAEEPQWQTSVRMTLPRLGGVSAVLTISQRGVAVMLRAESAQTAATLNEQSPSLRQALYAAGVIPIEVTVRKHDEA